MLPPRRPRRPSAATHDLDVLVARLDEALGQDGQLL
jgi:hypothetical protein